MPVYEHEFPIDPRLVEPIARAISDLETGFTIDRLDHVVHRLAAQAFAAGRGAALLELRTTEQIAAELGVSRARIQQLARTRNLGWKITDRVRVFTAADVDAMRSRIPGRPRSPAPAPATEA